MLYGATTNMLMNVFGALGVETTFADASAIWRRSKPRSQSTKPGAVVMESITNPLLRVCALDKIAAMARGAGAPLIVDNTFATPHADAAAGTRRAAS